MKIFRAGRRLWAQICLWAMILPLPMLMGGCWDQKQISDLAVVMGAGIDLLPPKDGEDEQLLLLTVELAHITTKNSEGEPVLASASGKTVVDAMGNLAQSLDHQLHWSHMRLLLIGEGAARSGIKQYLSLFYNDHQMSPHIFFAICEGEAKQTLRGRAGLSVYASEGLHNILLKQRNDANGYITPISLQGFMSEVGLPHSGFLAPLIAQSQSEKDSQERADLYFKAMAILDENTAYRGQLNAKENSGAALLRGEARDFMITFREPEQNTLVSVELSHWRVRPTWQFGPTEQELKLTLSCRARGLLVEEQEALDYSDKEAVRRLEELFAQELSRQIWRAWQRARAAKVDFLGLGRQLFQRHNEKWESLLPQWPQLLREIELEIEIDSKIRVAGQSN